MGQHRSRGNPLDAARGVAAVSALLKDWRSAFTEYEFGVDRCIDAGERVVLLCWQRGRGDRSALPVTMHFAQIITVRGGKIVLTVNYTNRQLALKAVGLTE
jgi:ketosteroid isomerase-like protein